MPLEISITDPDDPRIADYRSLSEAELLRARGAFIAEGRLVVRRLIEDSAYRTRSVLVTPAARTALDEALSRLPPTVPLFLCAPALVQAITGFNIHRGCLAVGERPAAVDPRTLLERGTTLVVLEGVGNADNVGGIFRNAAAFGAAGVVLGPGSCDPLYRKAVRTSMGAALTVPFAVDPGWPGVLSDLREAGWTIWALTPDAAADDLELVPRGEPARIALLLGAEGFGLSAAALALADRRVRIPMRSNTDSVNVVVACGIALHWMLVPRAGARQM